MFRDGKVYTFKFRSAGGWQKTHVIQMYMTDCSYQVMVGHMVMKRIPAMPQGSYGAGLSL